MNTHTSLPRCKIQGDIHIDVDGAKIERTNPNVTIGGGTIPKDAPPPWPTSTTYTTTTPTTSKTIRN